MSHWIHPEAEAELGDAAVHYAIHASPAIAEAFIEEYERVLELIIDNPRRAARDERGFRRQVFGRFPYAVIYDADDPQLGPQIYAITHQAREPGYWATRAAK